MNPTFIPRLPSYQTSSRNYVWPGHVTNFACVKYVFLIKKKLNFQFVFVSYLLLGVYLFPPFFFFFDTMMSSAGWNVACTVCALSCRTESGKHLPTALACRSNMELCSVPDACL